MSEPSLHTGAAPPPVGQPPTPPRPPLGAGRIIAIIAGAVLCLIGLGLLGGGAALAAAAHSRDTAGFVTSGTAPVDSDAYAVVVPGIGVNIHGPDQVYVRGMLGTVRIRATGRNPEQPVFLGLARSQDVDAYLRGVGHDEVRDLNVDPTRTEYTNRAGGAPASPPGGQKFWVGSDSGTGTRTVEWQVAARDWTVVVMNADGSAGVHADVDVGGQLPVLRGTTIGLFVGGGLLLIGGVLLIVLPLVSRRRAG